jgi:hypothetical protein
MQPVIYPQCSLQLAHFRDIATSGIKHILELAEQMETETANLPDELKPFGEMLTEIAMQVIIKSYAKSLQPQFSEGLQKITRVALLPNHQTEKE